ncbi:MAG: discoidin domain-containing protein, partial [Fibrobacterales bacterium]
MKTSTKISRALRLILSVTALLACVTTVSAQELIKNGTFNSGKTNWQLGVYGANAQSTVSNNSYSTTITDGGSDTWRIQLTQGGIPQVNGETYTFSFEAQASSSRTFDAMVEKNGSPWTNYSASNNQTLTTTWQLFTYTYTHRGSNDNNARITFNMGNNNHDVQIRNVSLYNGVLVQHDLTTSVIGSGSITPEMGKFNNDEAITITATPDEGWGFVQWGGDITGTTNPSTIIMDDAKNIVAEFVQLPTYSLSVVANTGGSVTPQLGTYYEGTPLSITAAPDAGWEFVAFTGDVQSSNNPLSITISHDMNIEASFRELPKNVALNKPASASTIEGSSYSATQAVDGSMSSRWSSHFSDPQWIEIDLEETYQVSQIVLHWETAGASDYEVQVSDNRIDWTTIHTEKNGNAGVDNRSVDGVGRYIRMYGTQRTTQWGYSLLEFEVYGVLSSYTLSTSVTGNGTITPDGGTYTPGTTVSITATPAEGWEFIGWSGDLTGTEQSATLTIDGNKNITAVFTEIPYYALHTTITGEGTVTPASGSYIRG